MNNGIREAMQLLIEYYTKSLEIQKKLYNKGEVILKKRTENDKKVLEILKEDYSVLFEVEDGTDNDK